MTHLIYFMKKTDISGVVDIIRDKYTLAKPCLVDGCPDAHSVWLKIRGHSFCIDGYQDTKDDADWMCKMLAKALATFLLENPEKTIPRRQIKIYDEAKDAPVSPVCNDQLDSHGSADEVVGTIGQICKQTDTPAYKMAYRKAYDKAQAGGMNNSDSNDFAIEQAEFAIKQAEISAKSEDKARTATHNEPRLEAHN